MSAHSRDSSVYSNVHALLGGAAYGLVECSSLYAISLTLIPSLLHISLVAGDRGMSAHSRDSSVYSNVHALLGGAAYGLVECSSLTLIMITLGIASH